MVGDINGDDVDAKVAVTAVAAAGPFSYKKRQIDYPGTMKVQWFTVEENKKKEMKVFEVADENVEVNVKAEVPRDLWCFGEVTDEKHVAGHARVVKAMITGCGDAWIAFIWPDFDGWAV